MECGFSGLTRFRGHFVPGLAAVSCRPDGKQALLDSQAGRVVPAEAQKYRD